MSSEQVNETEVPSSKKAVFRWVKLIVSLSLIGLLISQVELRSLRDFLVSMDLRYVFLTVFFQFLLFLLESLRFSYHFRQRQDIWPRVRDFGLVESIELTFSCYAVTLFTPGSLGADGYRSLRTRKYSGSVIKSAMLITLIRLTAIVTTCVTVAVTFLIAQPDIGLQVKLGEGMLANQTLIAISCIALSIVLIVLSRVPAVVIRFNRLKTAIAKTISSFTLLEFLMLILFSVAIDLTKCGMMLGVVWAAGLEISFSYALLTALSANTVSVLAISIAGLGVNEGVKAFLLTGAGLSAKQSISIALSGRLILTICKVIGVVTLLLNRHEVIDQSSDSA